jgi:tetratricopeptide (TPR) repeat protein
MSFHLSRNAKFNHRTVCQPYRAIACLLPMLLGLALAGCAAPVAFLHVSLPDRFPSQHRIVAVPFFPQTGHQCGPAALAMALQYSGAAATTDELQAAVYTPGRKGSLQSGMITAARRHDRLAYPIQGLEELLQEVAAGNPVIVLQNLGLQWMPRWHYAVVIGFDLQARSITLHSGKQPARRVALKTFHHTWRRAQCWGLLVLSPGRLPATVLAPTYLKAALGLQKAGFAASSVKAFRSAVRKWPDNITARLGLGNALYTTGNLAAAADAFQQVTALDPQHGAALNNLAHVIAQLGDLEKAESMARRAMALGGRHAALYRKTLEEILKQKYPK